MLRKIYRIAPLEVLCWTIALILLAFNNPYHADDNISLCLSHNLGLGNCPGCGLGNSISYFLRGDIEASLAQHPLGIITCIALIFRNFKLIKTHLSHGQRN